MICAENRTSRGASRVGADYNICRAR
jgi:hypothetical protein